MCSTMKVWWPVYKALIAHPRALKDTVLTLCITELPPAVYKPLRLPYNSLTLVNPWDNLQYFAIFDHTFAMFDHISALFDPNA